MFYNFNTTATQKRTGSYSGNKASVASTNASFVGSFEPIDPKMSINLGFSGQGYQFICDGSADIKANDVLTINAVDYNVQGISRFRQASIDILKCVLVLSVKA